MFAKGATLLLAMVASTMAAEPVEKPDCECYEYLKSKPWDYLKTHGFSLEKFCCLVGAANYCYQGSYNYGYVAAAAGATVDYSSYGYDYDYHLAYCVDYVGLGRLSHYYSDGYGGGYGGGGGHSGGYGGGGGHGGYGGGYGGGYTYGVPLKSEDEIATLGYGYKPEPCSWAKDYAGYVKCVFTLYFKEALQACYCYYRTEVHCECDDCNAELDGDKDQGGKDILVDRYVAGNNPELVCNQCPQEDKPKDDSPYGGAPYGQAPPKKDYGYDLHFKGIPYDPCAGYCYLIEPFSRGHSD